MDPVATQYIERDGAALAYQVLGEGPAEVVYAMDIFQHIDLQWTDPHIHDNYERMAGFSRMACAQPRGFGSSEQVPYYPTIEQQADDLMAIMDAVNMRRVTLAANWTTCGAAALVAARAPERVSGLVLLEPFPQGVGSAALRGWTNDESRVFVETFRHAVTHWGSGHSVNVWMPSLSTAYNRRLMALLERCSATPAAAQRYLDWSLRLDIQDILRSVHVPTRVATVANSAFPNGAVEYAASLLPAATFHELPPTPRGTSLGRTIVPFLDHIEEAATGAKHSERASRYLATVLFTDVVSSTELVARVGDARYREMRADHERTVRLALDDHGGELMTVSGDGTLSVFSGPSAAVQCAETIRHESAVAGIEVRAGIHTGELERDAMNVTGLAVHIGARVASAADPGQILVSRTVRDLVAGSGLNFTSVGTHELKGVPDTWELFAVSDANDHLRTAPGESIQTPMDKLALRAARKTPSLARAAVRLGNAIERRRARQQ